MFYLTSDIEIGGIKVKANKVTWKTSVNSFTDTCTISLPRTKYLKTDATTTANAEDNKKVYAFKEDDKVTVKLGYDGKNETRFMGFVKRVNMGIPVEVECEGYSYQLYDIIFSRTYTSVTVKKLLQDVTAGTDILLSKEMPDIPLKNVRFKNATGIQVLEWLVKECKLSVYFNFNELYVGTLFGKKQDEIKVHLGWNSVKDDGLKKKEVDKNMKIVIKEKNQAGEVQKVKSDDKNSKRKTTKHRKARQQIDKYSNEKQVKIKAGIPAQFLKEIAQRLESKENYRGYEGDVTIFLVPYAEKGMVCEITDKVFHERQGRYFVDTVSGEFGEGGGRQTLTLGLLMPTK
jgi:hypothetical protein